MKKTSILSFLLAALMICSVLLLTGCGDDDKTSSGKSTSTRETQVVSMYIITEDTTTQAQADMVEMELNRILLPNYETMIDINYIKADEYWAAVEGALDATDPENSKDVVMPASVKGLEGKAFTDMIEYIFADSTKSIELGNEQIDIFVVDDYEKYVELVNDGKIKAIDSYITYDSKILSTNIHPTFMSASKIAGMTYGIPTNVPVTAGEYTYLIVNEDLVKKYEFELKNVKNYSTNLENFLSAVKAGEPGVWPMSEPLEVAGAEYYDGSYVAVNPSVSSVAMATLPVFQQSDFVSNRAATEKYKNAGYFPAEPSDAYRYAIKVEKSDVFYTDEADKRWTAEDGTTYVRYLYDIPRVSIDEAFTSVMCVSATSPIPDRAMEIITHFQTNPELANMLQFGIEGEHYQLDKLDGTISILTDEYAMNTLITGNTYIKYNVENDDEYLDKAIAANLNVAPSSYLGLNDTFTGKMLSQVELSKSINRAGSEAVENGESFAQVSKLVSYENSLLNYSYDSFANTATGPFSDVLNAFKASASPISKTYNAGVDVVKYNDYILGETTDYEIKAPMTSPEKVVLSEEITATVEGTDVTITAQSSVNGTIFVKIGDVVEQAECEVGVPAEVKITGLEQYTSYTATVWARDKFESDSEAAEVEFETTEPVITIGEE